MRECIPHDAMFKSMHNIIIHIKEKWFYMAKHFENYYLLQDKDEPYCTCKNKNFIPKVIFLADVTRLFDSRGNEIFSGKIGIFSFVTQEPAKKTSVNRVARTTETKAITSVKRDVVRSFLVDKVLPAIKGK
jgi:hypothetical protein